MQPRSYLVGSIQVAHHLAALVRYARVLSLVVSIAMRTAQLEAMFLKMAAVPFGSRCSPHHGVRKQWLPCRWSDGGDVAPVHVVPPGWDGLGALSEVVEANLACARPVLASIHDLRASASG